ncbi:MAG: pitrilysin family protein [Chloroflexota bacterium]
MLHTHTFANGLRVLVEELPHTHSVSIGFFIGVGSEHETRPTCGISHFIEHMLFKGSTNYPSPKSISDAIEGVGGVLDAYTGVDSTVYYAKVADIHVERAINVLTDMVLRPRFDLQDIEKERRVIIEELRETEDTPSELIDVLLDAAMWGDQPLGRDVAGDYETVTAITHADLLAHWQTYYTRANTIVSIAGNITADQALQMIEHALTDMVEGTPSSHVPTQASHPGPKLSLHTDDSEQSYFSLGLPGIAYTDPRRRAMAVLDTIVGGGSSSRLFQEIREERGLAYTVGSFVREHHDTGKWIMYGSVKPEMLHESVATIIEQLRDIRRHGVTAAELQQVKEQVKGGMLLSLEDTWSVASRNGAHMLRYGRVLAVEQVVAEIEAVTHDDVLHVAQHALRNDALHLAIIGPHDHLIDTQTLLDVEEPIPVKL